MCRERGAKRPQDLRITAKSPGPPCGPFATQGRSYRDRDQGFINLRAPVELADGSDEPLPLERVPALLPFGLLQVVGTVGQEAVQKRKRHADAVIHRARDLATRRDLVVAQENADGDHDGQHDQVLLPQPQHEPVDRAEEKGDEVVVDQQLLAKWQGAESGFVGLGGGCAVLIEESETLPPFWLEVIWGGLGLWDAFHW